MVRLSTLFAVTVSMLTTTTTLVAGFSNMPGACRLSGMKTTVNNPHGFAPSTDMTFNLAVQPSSTPNTYTVTLTGTGTNTFTGVLLFAQDENNGTRFGSFSNIPTGYALLTTCGDINAASNTLGHNSAAPKTLPASFTWSDGGYPQPWNGVFSALIMTADTTKWYTSNPLVFASTGGATPSMTSAAAPPPAGSNPMMMSPSATAAATPAAGGPPAMGGGGMPSNSSSSMNMTMSSNSSMTSSAMDGASMTTSTMMDPTAANQNGAASNTPMLSGSARFEAPLSFGLVVASLVLLFSL